jgi:hypothetical protein
MGNFRDKGSVQNYLRSPHIQSVINSNQFCSFCILESHVKTLYAEQGRGTPFVYPLAVIIFIKKIA